MLPQKRLITNLIIFLWRHELMTHRVCCGWRDIFDVSHITFYSNKWLKSWLMMFFWPFKAYFTVETCYLSVNVLSKLSLIIFTLKLGLICISILVVLILCCRSLRLWTVVCIRAFLSNKRLERNFLSSYDLVSGPAIAPVPAQLC